MGFKDNGARQMAKAGYKKAKAVEQANSELSAYTMMPIVSDALTEAVAALSIPVTKDGRKLKKAEVLFSIPACTGNEAIWLRINGVDTGNYYTNASKITQAEVGRGNTGWSRFFVELRFYDGDVTTRAGGVYASSEDAPTWIQAPVYVLHGSAVDGIASLLFGVYGNAFEFPIGTKYSVCGEVI